MTNIQTYNNNASSKEIVQALQTDGCVIIENILSFEEHRTLQEDLQVHMDTINDCKGDFYGHSTKRLGLLFNKSKIFEKMALSPLILKIMDSFLLPNCSQYQINLTQAISIGKNEPQQIMHQDDPMFPFLHPGYEVMLNCMWAIDDFTEDNGATVLVPGSHTWNREESLNLNLNDLPAKQVVKGVMKKGSVLIYLGSLFHCGGRNATEKRRCGAVISYSLGWLRQAENSYLGYTKDELLAMPEKLQELLGYFVHKPNLGSIDGRSPHQFIKNRSDGLFTEFLPEDAQKLVKNYREKEIKKAA